MKKNKTKMGGVVSNALFFRAPLAPECGNADLCTAFPFSTISESMNDLQHDHDPSYILLEKHLQDEFRTHYASRNIESMRFGHIDATNKIAVLVAYTDLLLPDGKPANPIWWGLTRLQALDASGELVAATICLGNSDDTINAKSMFGPRGINTAEFLSLTDFAGFDASSGYEKETWGRRLPLMASASRVRSIAIIPNSVSPNPIARVRVQHVAHVRIDCHSLNVQLMLGH
jgi:hypothetical protein